MVLRNAGNIVHSKRHLNTIRGLPLIPINYAEIKRMESPTKLSRFQYYSVVERSIILLVHHCIDFDVAKCVQYTFAS